MFNPLSIVSSAVSGVFGYFEKRQERKAATEMASAKLVQSKQDNEHTLNLNKDEYEAIATAMLGSSWKDEYATVSIISILNLVVLGGVVSAVFGRPEILEGIGLAIMTLVDVGVDVGFLITAVTLAAVGLSVWKRV